MMSIVIDPSIAAGFGSQRYYHDPVVVIPQMLYTMLGFIPVIGHGGERNDGLVSFGVSQLAKMQW